MNDTIVTALVDAAAQYGRLTREKAWELERERGLLFGTEELRAQSEKQRAKGIASGKARGKAPARVVRRANQCFGFSVYHR